MTDYQWAEVDQGLFDALERIKVISQEYRKAKDDFGVRLMSKLGRWIAARHGRSLRARGIEPEDVLHQVYIVIHERLFLGLASGRYEFPSPSSLSAFVFKTVKGVIADLWKRATPVDIPGIAEETPGLSWIWRYLPFLDPEERCDPPLIFEETDFEEREQEALYSWYVDKLPHKDIGKRTGISENAAKQLVYRAKKKLAALMPRYAAEECVDLLSPVIPNWLGETGAPAEPEARVLDRLHHPMDILVLGLEAECPQSCPPTCKTCMHKALSRRMGDAVAGHSRKAVRRDTRHSTRAVCRAIAEMLSYLALGALRRIQRRRWDRDTTQATGVGVEPEVESFLKGQLPEQDREPMIFLFFCLATMLQRESELEQAQAQTARHILATHWPKPTTPIDGWCKRVGDAIMELDIFLKSQQEDHSKRRLRDEQDVPSMRTMTETLFDQCLLMAFVRANASAIGQLCGDRRGPVTDWLRDLPQQG